ncbi:MAG: hypothetical protein II937_12040 [Bacteroidales bacterium]|nr:hypothetical protein [Bacteroidales bacterium]
MRTLFLRKKIGRATNKTFDEFMLRVVKASETLKGEAFKKLTSDFKASAKRFNEVRVATPSTKFTDSIHEISQEADKIFRKIKLAIDFYAECCEGDVQTCGEELRQELSVFGNIAATGITKKFADYRSLIAKIRNYPQSITLLNLEKWITALETLLEGFREKNLKRDDFRSSVKGLRYSARQQAQKNYIALRDYVEAYTVVNGKKDVEDFIGFVNEALIWCNI